MQNEICFNGTFRETDLFFIRIIIATYKKSESKIFNMK